MCTFSVIYKILIAICSSTLKIKILTDKNRTNHINQFNKKAKTFNNVFFFRRRWSIKLKFQLFGILVSSIVMKIYVITVKIVK